MYKTKIIFFGTRGLELTNYHLTEFIKCGANIIGFVEAPSGRSNSTLIIEKSTDEDIDKVAVRLKKPILCPQDPKDEGFIEELKKLNADIYIVVGYQFFLPKNLFDLPRFGTINFHTSLLPRHTGMHPGFWTLWYGDKETGMVIHFMDEGIDTGDIIYETRVPVKACDTIYTVYHRVWDTSIPLIKRLLEDIDSGNIPRKAQDQSKYFYNYEITDKDYELDFRQPAEILFGRVSMQPGKFYFIYNDNNYYIKSCTVIDEPVKNRNFIIRAPYIFDKKLTFATPRKFLQIDELLKNGIEIDPTTIIDKQ